MIHSIKRIGEEYEHLSNLRKDEKRFTLEKFLNFAKDNKSLYFLIEERDDFLVSTWYADNLINDFRKSL